MIRNLCIVISCVLLSIPSFAGRSLKEAKDIRKVSQKLSKREIKRIIKSKNLSDDCPINILKSSTIGGTRCRLALLEAHIHKSKLRNKGHLDYLLKYGKSSLQTAHSLAKYQPINRIPNFDFLKLKAHKSSCAIVLDIAAKLDKQSKNLPKKYQKRAYIALKGDEKKKGFFLEGCECARDTIGLSALVRNISVAEQGQLQAVLISQGCFLDKDKMAQKRGGPESSFSEKAQKVATSQSQNAQFLAYAKTRDVGLTRCRKSAEDGLLKKEMAKVQKCVCSEMKRWRFPKERGRKDVNLILPIMGEDLQIHATVSQVGKVSNCGELSGTLIDRLK